MPAPTPEALMRSRYAAYAVGEVDYILATTAADGSQWQADAETWAAEVRRFCVMTRFEKLEIREVGPVADERGEVTFFARLSRAGEDASFVERSAFVRRDGRWLYLGPIEALSGSEPA